MEQSPVTLSEITLVLVAIVVGAAIAFIPVVIADLFG